MGVFMRFLFLFTTFLIAQNAWSQSLDFDQYRKEFVVTCEIADANYDFSLAVFYVDGVEHWAAVFCDKADEACETPLLVAYLEEINEEANSYKDFQEFRGIRGYGYDKFAIKATLYESEGGKPQADIDFSHTRGYKIFKDYPKHFTACDVYPID